MRRVFAYLATIGLLLAAAVGGYLYHLDRTITGTFEGRRWSVPAQVYAQPLELYPGVPLTRAAVRFELERLGYNSHNFPDAAGSFELHGQANLNVHLRSFRFVDGYRSARRVTLAFGAGGGKLAAIREADGSSVPLLRLEPPNIGSFFLSHGEDRVVLPPQQVPVLLREGLKAVEDRNFDNHHGFDLRGILRALWVNLRSGETQQGGSTITQQLVKSYFLSNEQTITRKLRELCMSIILELRFAKNDLLNAYVNEVYLAQDGARAIHGFGLGSQFYFNKPLAELEPAEIALLLTVIRGPSYYNPKRHPERVRERRNRILHQLHDDGLIRAGALTRGLASPLGLSSATRRARTYYPAFMDLVREQLRADYPTDALASDGLRIFTTLQPRQQDALQRSADLALDTLRGSAEIRAELQLAALVTQNQTGEVLALLGGHSDARGGFNRALRAQRPIGSLIKPLVYLTALESGEFHLASQLPDAPVRLELPNGDVWQPTNFDGINHGSVPLIRALADSLNLATVHLGLQVGIERVAQRLAELTPHSAPAYPSLLLGAPNMRPVDVAEFYGALASGGFHTPPKAVIAVQDEAGEPRNRYPLATRQLIEHDAVVQLNRALQIALARGTGRSSSHASSGAAGKTGTSNDYRDSWFAGFDANRLTVVWVGNDDNSPTGLTGASGALRVWDAFVSTGSVSPVSLPILAKRPNQTIEYATGLLADASCADVVAVPLPAQVRLPAKPGCRPGNNLGGRVRDWFRKR